MLYEVGRFGAFLATRDKAAKVREDLEKRIRKQPDGETVEVKFLDVDAVTVSFADELIGKLISNHAAGDLPSIAVVLTGLNEELREAFAVCLSRRGIAAVERRNRRLELLGADKPLLETFTAAVSRKQFRAAQVADLLGISPQNANNRLKRLVSFAALVRVQGSPETGGREFVYRIPKVT